MRKGDVYNVPRLQGPLTAARLKKINRVVATKLENAIKVQVFTDHLVSSSRTVVAIDDAMRHTNHVDSLKNKALLIHLEEESCDDAWERLCTALKREFGLGGGRVTRSHGDSWSAYALLPVMARAGPSVVDRAVVGRPVRDAA